MTELTVRVLYLAVKVGLMPAAVVPAQYEVEAEFPSKIDQNSPNMW